MAYKIAFASSDGENINQKFHDSHNFIIYEVSDTLKWKQLEIRNCKVFIHQIIMACHNKDLIRPDTCNLLMTNYHTIYIIP